MTDLADASLLDVAHEDSAGPLLQRLCSALDVEIALLLVHDEARARLVVRAAAGLGPDPVSDRPITDPELVRRVLDARTGFVLLPDPDQPSHAFELEYGLTAVLLAPLMVAGEPAGAIVAGSRRPHSFTRHDLTVLELAADGAGLLLEQRALQASLQHTRAESDAAHRRLAMRTRVSALFTEKIPDYNALLDTVAREVAAITGDACTVRLLSDDGELLVRAASDHADPAIRDVMRREMGRTLRRNNLGIWKSVIEERQLIHFSSVRDGLPATATAAQAKELQRLDLRYAMVVPLLAPGRVIGGIALVRFGNDTPFTEEDEHLLSDLADRAAQAIDNSRLFAAEREARLAAEVAGRRLRTIVDAIPLPLVSANRDGLVWLWNPACERLFGWSAEEVLGHPSPIVPPREREITAEMLSAAFEHGDTLSQFETTRMTKDGREIDVLISSAPFIDDAGAMTGIVGMIVDITDRRRLEETRTQLAAQEAEMRIRAEAEAQVRRSEEFLQKILDNAPFVVAAKDLEGRLILVNKALEEQMMLPRNRVLGQPAVSAWPQSVAEGSAALDLQALESNGPVSVEWDQVHRNERRVYMVTHFPLSDVEGKPYAVGTIAVDIKDRKLMEERIQQQNAQLEERTEDLRQASQMKSAFLANMSHELRTPLNAIIGFAELMYDGLVGPVSDEHREYLGDILTSSRHVLQIINDILDLSKVEAGRMELHPEPIELASVLEEVATRLMPLVAAKDLSLTVHPPEPGLRLVADRGRFVQIMTNLLSNAVKFTSSGGRVDVSSRRDGPDFVAVTVSDTGVGIARDDQRRIFDQFEQVWSAARRQQQGTGLGLALTRHLVELHGGTIGVESVPGEGSTFIVTLPRAPSDRMAGTTPDTTFPS